MGRHWKTTRRCDLLPGSLMLVTLRHLCVIYKSSGMKSISRSRPLLCSYQVQSSATRHRNKQSRPILLMCEDPTSSIDQRKDFSQAPRSQLILDQGRRTKDQIDTPNRRDIPKTPKGLKFQCFSNGCSENDREDGGTLKEVSKCRDT